MYLTKTKFYGEIELWDTKPQYDEGMDIWYDVVTEGNYISCDVSHIKELSKLVTFENSPLRIEINISLSQEVD